MMIRRVKQYRLVFLDYIFVISYVSEKKETESETGKTGQDISDKVNP